ncbi:hypothetical protein CVT24_007237 [Panaeolus cyanescens]|uniref:Uncharacterized protein n=1 Tax=Panaeolus cyanescens TaxID=181874 RepID=A0A409YPC0_9AGAR|nr:hypothetical protein CVT24_007237 [Panaeolus cyanescens]
MQHLKHRNPMNFGCFNSTYCLRYILSFFLLFNWAPYARAQRNVTVDDWESSISYSPPGAWTMSANTSLDFGGAHMLTQNPSATAVFNFTGEPDNSVSSSSPNAVLTLSLFELGIAIYFLSPLWPYHVTTAVSLDSGPTTLIDLVDHSSPNIGTGPETVPFRAVWSATGLSDTAHSLRIFVGQGEPYAIVDGLIYTTNAPASSSAAPSSSSPTVMTGRVVASSTANAANNPGDEPSKSKPVLAVTIGTILGILGLLVIIAFIWYFCRKRRRPLSEAWTVASSSLSSPGGAGSRTKSRWSSFKGSKSAHGAAGYYMTQSSAHGAWQNPQYGFVGMPPPPLPSGYAYQYPDQQHQYYTQDGGIQVVAPPYNRAPNRYQPGYTLSTITEKSTPQMGENRTPLAPTPASIPSELGSSTYNGSASGGSFYGGDRTSANMNAVAVASMTSLGKVEVPKEMLQKNPSVASRPTSQKDRESEKENLGEAEGKPRRPARTHTRTGASRVPPDLSTSTPQWR